MKKLLIVVGLTTLIGCSDKADPWYEYVPVSNEDTVDKSWFSSTHYNIKDSYSNILESKEKLDISEADYDWFSSVPWVLHLSNNYELCLNETNSYNYEAVNFDQATFDMWNLPKYIPFEKCY